MGTQLHNLSVTMGVWEVRKKGKKARTNSKQPPSRPTLPYSTVTEKFWPQHTGIHRHIRTPIHIHMQIQIYMYIYIYMCIHKYIYI